MENQRIVSEITHASNGVGVNMLAVTLGILSLGLFQAPLASLVSLALRDDRYSYTLLVPIISGFLLWLRKEDLLKRVRYSPMAGIPLLLAGLLIAAVPVEELGLTIFGVLVYWLGVAVLCYGTQTMRAAVFPSLFLLLLIPAPTSTMDQLVAILQKASADTTAGLFHWTGIAFVRDGFRFALNTVDIEIAEECSGVRSATSIFISCVLASHLLLRTGWSRVGFVVLSIPVVIFKNAARITGITWLGLNVDPGFFTGDLHKHSGQPFSLLAVAMLVPALWALRRIERNSQTVR